MPRARGPSGWAVILIAALLIALASGLWALGERTAKRAGELTVPPVDLPQGPPAAPPVEPPPVPTPGPT